MEIYHAMTLFEGVNIKWKHQWEWFICDGGFCLILIYFYSFLTFTALTF